MGTPTIFISYRRDDCAGHAGRLCDRLETAFGPDAVFRDVEDIAAGDDFVSTLHAQVDRCDVLLALIGPRWLSAADAQGRRRLENENDWVRREIARGLSREIRVIPVLLQGAQLPDRSALPEELAPLVRRQALEIRETQFEHDIEHLVRQIAPEYGRLRRYRVLIGALLVAVIGLGLLAWQLHRARSPEVALEWLNDNGYDYTAEAFLDAVDEGNALAVRRYLQAGMDPDDTDPERYSALIAAAVKGSPETARLLLEYDADPTDALSVAIGREQDAVTELLLEHEPSAEEVQKALGNAAYIGRIDLMERLVAMGAQIDGNESDALLSAVRNGQVESLRWLLARGAKPALATRDGDWTALHQAVAYSEGKDAGQIADALAELLLAAGQDAGAVSASQGRMATTPLLIAIGKYNAAAALRLIEAGAPIDVRMRDREESNALHLAAEKNLPEVLRALLARGAEADARDRRGRTALMLASGSGSLVALPALIEARADLEARDGQGLTALLHAVAALQPASVDALLSAGAAVDAASPGGDTALLRLAARAYHPGSVLSDKAVEIARRLIAAGAALDARNAQGRTALELATDAGSADLVAVLRR